MYRPTYHYLPEKNWMNDPNGVCFYKGEYHLFFQYNPHGENWGDIHWGHAKSKDLIHWEHLPIALTPSHDKGEVHCFSGCVNLDTKEPLLFYTSVGEGKRDCRQGAQQWAAVSHDDLLTWEKLPNNPILKPEDHGDIEVLDWRDPFIWKEGEVWYMVLGAAYENKGAVLIYRSEDLMKWAYLNILLKTTKEEVIWECPNYLKFEDEDVLVYSPANMVHYAIGKRNDQQTFDVRTLEILDYSGMDGFYAPNTFIDEKGRKIMIGWLTETARGTLEVPGQWKGVQSIPRVLTMEQGELKMRPIPELETIRGVGEIIFFQEVTEVLPIDTHSKAMEILLEVPVTEETSFSLDVFVSASGTERTRILYNGVADSVTLDRSQSSASGLTQTHPLICPHARTQDGKLKLHVFLDYSTIEVFINERHAISSRVYPVEAQADEVFLVVEGKVPVLIEKMEVYVLKA